MAACEQNNATNVVKMNLIPYAFYSYYYMRKSKAATSNMVNNRDNHELIFVDSGAHTFFAENHEAGLSVAGLKKKSKTKETPKEFMDNYKKWLLKHYKDLDYFAELDIGEIVGQDIVLQWREDLKELGLYDKCVTVFHPNIMTFEDYIDMLEHNESGYIALEGDRDNRDRIKYNKYIYEAYKRGIKVHGFAMTKNDVFFNYGFFSVDSTSWKSGAMFGTVQILKNFQMQAIECKSLHDAKHIKDVSFTELHNEVKSKQSDYRFMISARSFLTMSKFLDKVWQKRGVIWN